MFLRCQHHLRQPGHLSFRNLSTFSTRISEDSLKPPTPQEPPHLPHSSHPLSPFFFLFNSLFSLSVFSLSSLLLPSCPLVCEIKPHKAITNRFTPSHLWQELSSRPDSLHVWQFCSSKRVDRSGIQQIELQRQSISLIHVIYSFSRTVFVGMCVCVGGCVCVWLVCVCGG